MKKTSYILILLFIFSFPGLSQEVITELYENPVIKNAIAGQHHQDIHLKSGDLDEELPVLLPFFDDFSVESVFPDSRRWTDDEVFVNFSYPYRSVNVGAATFDALDSRGNLHPDASTFPFLSDSLNSRLIRLDSVFYPVSRAITTADSIYFSFFYQPQGRGNPPESWDSLVLKFGYDTGELHFAGYYDSITVPLNVYIGPSDTIWPGDTIYSPRPECDSGLFLVSNRIYTYYDNVTLPCDSVFEPTIKWNRIWSAEGMRLNDFYDEYHTYSKQVMIPVTDSAIYFRKDFRFKFYNYASLASDYNPSWRSNCDHWNLDYIYLNINRSKKDTIYRDISFVESAPSMLTRYQQMPFNQYWDDPTNETKDQLELFITNLDTLIYNTKYNYYITDEFGVHGTYIYHGEFCNLFPFYTSGYQNCIDCPQHACPLLAYYFSPGTGDSALFSIRHVVLGDFTSIDTIGDTISYSQKFYNYYAYDDGTPEAGYGLVPAGAKLAYKFDLNIRDTLRAIRMFFNHTEGDANEQLFNIKVWRDNNGVPGEELYSQLNAKVEYPYSLTDMYTYMLDDPVPVNGIFYIGWEQTTNANLNLGFDRNIDARENIYYNSLGQWLQSTQQGALMMRPVLGKKFENVGIDENISAEMQFKIYPNPLTDGRLCFEFSDNFPDIDKSNMIISIYNIWGQQVFESVFKEAVNLINLPKGIYFVRLIDRNTMGSHTSKLIIAR